MSNEHRAGAERPQDPVTHTEPSQHPDPSQELPDAESAPESSRSSMSYTRTYSTPATGAQTPDPLMGTTIVDSVALQNLSFKKMDQEPDEPYTIDTKGPQVTNRKASISGSRSRDDVADEA